MSCECKNALIHVVGARDVINLLTHVTERTSVSLAIIKLFWNLLRIARELNPWEHKIAAAILKILTSNAVSHMHQKTKEVNKNSTRPPVSYLWDLWSGQYRILGNIEIVERYQNTRKESQLFHIFVTWYC